MARAKVENKYRAILDAAIEVFAERGFWDTPTSLISKTAGVADGTLFNYFKTKDDLIHEVYLDIKKDMAHWILSDVDAHDTVKDRMRHIWFQFVAWGVENPDKFKVLQQIGTYELREEVKAAAMEPFAPMHQMVVESIANGTFHDYPVAYLGTLLENQVMVAIRYISADRDQMAYFQQIGFDILWNGVTR